jgi:hypothetical protein
VGGFIFYAARPRETTFYVFFNDLGLPGRLSWRKN